MPRNGYVWPPNHMAILGRPTRDARVRRAILPLVMRFRRAEVEPLLADVFHRATEIVTTNLNDDFVAFLERLKPEVSGADSLSFYIFFDLFREIRDARFRYSSDPLRRVLFQPLGPLALAVDEFLGVTIGRWAPTGLDEDGNPRPLGGVDEELLEMALGQVSPGNDDEDEDGEEGAAKQMDGVAERMAKMKIEEGAGGKMMPAPELEEMDIDLDG